MSVSSCGEKELNPLGLGSPAGPPGLACWELTVSNHVLNRFTDHQVPRGPRQWPGFSSSCAEQGSFTSFVQLTLLGAGVASVHHKCSQRTSCLHVVQAQLEAWASEHEPGSPSLPFPSVTPGNPNREVISVHCQPDAPQPLLPLPARQ